MSLLVTIPSGSFFLSQYLTDKIRSNDISDTEISYGIKQRVIEAVNYRFLKVDDQSIEWFYLAKILAKTDKEVAFKLAVIYYIEGDTPHAIYWYKQAAYLKHSKAKQALIDLYISEHEFTLAKDLLLPLKANKEALNQLLTLAVTLGDKKLITDLVPLLEVQPHNKLLKQLKKYQITAVEHPVEKTLCANSIQFFATNLKHLNKLDKLIISISEHPLGQYFCFNTPRYIPLQQLDCRFDIDKAIQCNDIVWSRFEPEISTRFIGLMLEKGGANVDNGIMYLDEFDDIDVFIHELSHLVGFVDEYILSKNHKVCQNAQESMFSHNISILQPYYEGSRKEVLAILAKQIPWFNLIDKQTPLLKRAGNKWKVGTPSHYLLKSNVEGNAELGLFEAETCQNNHVVAFKPTIDKTSLRYYEARFIETYVDFLKTKPAHFLMPSYHYNIAKSLLKNNQEALAFQWLQKALNNEVNDGDEYQRNRYNKVKLGKY